MVKQASNGLAALLAGRTPEAMYDALYAGRLLSAAAEGSPPKVVARLKTLVRNAHASPVVPATLYERLAAVLRAEGFLSAAGEALASEPVADIDE